MIIAVSYKIADKCVQKSINSDLCVCLKINRHLLKYDKDLVHLAVYIPPYKTRYSYVGMFDELSQTILDIGTENHHFLICGDMNAHTQERDDIAVIDGDNSSLDVNNGEKLCTVGQLEMFNIPLKRKSTNIHRDFSNYGNALLEMCRNLTFCILEWQMW